MFLISDLELTMMFLDCFDLNHVWFGSIPFGLQLWIVSAHGLARVEMSFKCDFYPLIWFDFFRCQDSLFTRTIILFCTLVLHSYVEFPWLWIMW